jgi:H+-transporting ATPase
LILTEPGLSPIYGAVLESRRIFARIKSYVVYRVAASIVLVLVLSIIIFSTGCAVDSLLVIILALLNDISMIPVAYDNADATTRPQLPNAKKLVLQSLFYGVFHTGAALAFIYGLDHADINNPIGLNAACDSETRGFIWFYLVLVTELAIFSVRAPLYFWKSLPSPILFLSVLLTCVVGALIAVFSKKLSPANMGYIILYNIGVFIVADVLKVWFRDIINDKPGEIIESDELIKVEEPKSETVKHMEKQMRYIVHRESVLQPSDVAHQIEMREETLVSKIFTDRRGSALSDGFVDKQRVRTRALSTPAGTPLFTRQKTYSSPVLGTIFES